MKIDLHCHTKKVKKGEATTRNVDAHRFSKKVEEAEVQIVAITNHNHFDIEQFNEFQEEVKAYCVLWPGIEIDIQGENNKGHLIVIANPDNVKLFNEKVGILLGNTSVDEFTVNLEKVFTSLDQCDVIYIPHFHKAPQLSRGDIEKLNNMLSDKSRLFKETSDYRSLGVFSNFDYSMIIGSDVQDWNDYEKSNFADIRLPIQTFKQFCLLARKDKQVINTLLNKKNKINIMVSPHKTSNFRIPIYEDINIIFGQKGTGKSEILRSLKCYYEEKSIMCQMYVGNDKEDDFNKFLKTTEMKRDVSNLGIEDCKDRFKEIYEWQEKKPTSIKNYIDWLKTKDDNKNKSKMKITDAFLLDTKIMDKNIDKDFKALKDFLDSQFMKLKIYEYLSEDEIMLLKELLDKLIVEIYTTKLKNWQDVNEIKLTNFSINKIKLIADKCSATVSKPSSTGFQEFAINRFALFDAVNSLKGIFETEKNVTVEPLGELEGKGEVFVQSMYRLLNNESRASEFSKGIKKLKDCKKIIFKLENKFYDENIIPYITEFRDLYDLEGIKDMSAFIGTAKIIVLKDGEEYKPSSGERGILLLQRLLDSDSDVYLLDEPELGMGNSYINLTILPKLINLAKARKTVVVATHNANIAVRTLPYVSIFRSHESGKYTTYIGNPFIDDLVNIEDENDIKNWTKESMHTLEGGKEAFYERKDIYESGRKDN